jgi:Tat protein secretion system quality control protein TatD with DNase activity
MLETDAPFMAVDRAWAPPETGLGRKNEPAAMPTVCRAVAAALGAELAEVAAVATVNSRRFFSLGAL